MTLVQKKVLAAIALVLAVAFIVTRTRTPTSQQPRASNDVPFMAGGAIHVSPGFIERAGIGFESVAERELSPVLQLSGVLTFDPFHLAMVGARIEGRIHALHKREGDRVDVGDTVAELESASVGQAQAEVMKSRAREAAASAEERRALALADEKVIAAREAEIAKATAIAARAERTAAESALQALGGDPSSSQIGILKLRSPLAGEIVKMQVHRGQVVDGRTTVFQVADLSKLWVELHVFAQDILAVRPGDPVEVEIAGLSLPPFRGKVDHVGNTIDEETRSADVRVVLDNSERKLRPGLAVRAKIVASGPKARSITVSTESIVRVDGKPTVFVARDNNEIEARTVTLGAHSDEHTAVASGLAVGERVVKQGVFALKSEIFR